MPFVDKNIRLIARLDVKGENLIKGVHLEGLRVLGLPEEFAQRYYKQGADELIYMDVVASLYGRSNLVEIVQRTAQEVFIPLTVGGGIRSIDDVRLLLQAGADKVAINTAAVQRPELISEVSRKFGSQCMVLSIEAKRHPDGGWDVLIDCGRESTGLDVLDWVQRGVELGAGEILLTSVDMEGTRNGFDVDLVEAVAAAVDVRIIASGGFGEIKHLPCVVRAGADAVAFADALHFQRITFSELRKAAFQFNIPVRRT